MRNETSYNLHPDPKGRVSLGKLIPPGTTTLRAWRDDQGNIILEPCTEIPVREAWLYKNKDALQAVQTGLGQSAAGKTIRRGTFTSYADQDE